MISYNFVDIIEDMKKTIEDLERKYNECQAVNNSQKDQLNDLTISKKYNF